MEHEQPSLGAEETEQAASHWYLAQPSHGGRAAPSPSLITRLRARQPTNGAPASGAFATVRTPPTSGTERATRRRRVPTSKHSADAVMQSLRRALELLSSSACEKSTMARETLIRPAPVEVPAIGDEVLSCATPLMAALTPGFDIYVDTPLRKPRVLQVTDDDESEDEDEDSGSDDEHSQRVALGHILDVNVI